VTDTETTDAGLRPMMRGGRRLRDGHVLYWWFEVLAILAFYLVYSAIRNANGVHPSHAFKHAKEIISLEHHLGIFHEATIQKWALHSKPLIITANYLYGSLHFVVTIAVGIWLYRKQSEDYPRFRNTLAVTTGLALIGFSLYPLMPPRLLHLEHFDLGFVDTLQKYPTIWSFDSGPAARVSNQYAAMPSVHIAWATWCALAMVPRLKSTRAKIIAGSYPFVTLVVIVITANHYVLDAVGGVLILGVGWVVAHKLTRAGRGQPVPRFAAQT
jgi:hypothetical protein